MQIVGTRMIISSFRYDIIRNEQLKYTGKYLTAYLTILVHLQAEQMFCITNSTSHHGLLLKILHFTQIQFTAVSLLQLMVTGGSHGARMNTV